MRVLRVGVFGVRVVVVMMPVITVMAVIMRMVVIMMVVVHIQAAGPRAECVAQIAGFHR